MRASGAIIFVLTTIYVSVATLGRYYNLTGLRKVQRVDFGH